MNSDRASAYGRVMKTIEDMGPAKLLDHETDEIREAADTLLFTEDSALAHEKVAELTILARNLVESERWIEDTAEQLLRDLDDCGPQPAFA